ncbi:MAG TPA: Xaa-Pro aminopeptidase [Gammaproteobacteria bacterium]|nr:Xaa-Pro aminopeptidase [Gammaproteobacteria bacterium]
MKLPAPVTQTELAKRRRQLMRMLGDNAVAVLPAAHEKIRNRDSHYAFRQDSDFLYLTGFNEPDAIAVLVPGRAAAEYILFCRERDPQAETWNGRRAGTQGAIDFYGADDAFPIEDMDDILPGLLEGRERVFYSMGQDAELDQHMVQWVNHLRQQSQTIPKSRLHDNGQQQGPQEFVSLAHLLHDMRLYKTPAEQKQMRTAAAISVAAHQRAMQVCRPDMYEYAIEAELLYEFHRHGGEPAYSSIVGGGANSCILHYVENNQALQDGELLLVDAGCEFRGYASDITRTYPVNGVFTPAQRAVYDVVLQAQLAAIDTLRPGNHWADMHDTAVKVLTTGLVKLGLLKGSVARLIKDESYRQFYMHKTGHWLGLDVHDVGDYRVGNESRVLEPGMVMTVEPGLYIPAQKGVPKKFWNIGVRIEDDVLVTRDKPEVLTQALIKDPAAIEAFMAQARAA